MLGEGCLLLRRVFQSLDFCLPIFAHICSVSQWAACAFEEELDKGSGSSWSRLVLSALINVRSRRDFLLGSKILSKFTVSASPYNSSAPLISVLSPVCRGRSLCFPPLDLLEQGASLLWWVCVLCLAI